MSIRISVGQQPQPLSDAARLEKMSPAANVPVFPALIIPPSPRGTREPAPKCNASGPNRIGGDRRSAAHRRAEHDRHPHPGYRRHGRAGQALSQAGADVVRIAADSTADAEALAEIRRQCSANLSVDLQENYRLAELVAPHVDKIRYNPGHLYHHERNKPWQDKVRFLAAVAREHDCAIRIGVNCGSVDPAQGAVRPARLDFTHVGQRLGTLRIAGFDRLYPVLRLAQGFGSGQSDRSQSPVRRAEARRSAASGGHGSRDSPRRHSSRPGLLWNNSSAAASAIRFACP